MGPAGTGGGGQEGGAGAPQETEQAPQGIFPSRNGARLCPCRPPTMAPAEGPACDPKDARPPPPFVLGASCGAPRPTTGAPPPVVRRGSRNGRTSARFFPQAQKRARRRTFLSPLPLAPWGRARPALAGRALNGADGQPATREWAKQHNLRKFAFAGRNALNFRQRATVFPGAPPGGGEQWRARKAPQTPPQVDAMGPAKEGGAKGTASDPARGAQRPPKGGGGQEGGGGRQGHRRRPIRAPRKEFCHKEWCPALPLQTADNGPRGRPRMRPEGRIRGELQQQPWPRKPLQIHAQMPR